MYSRSGAASQTPSAAEVLSFLGRTFGAGAALTLAVYLLHKLCLKMAWKSGGASHAELVNNLRSELPRIHSQSEKNTSVIVLAMKTQERA